MAVLGTGASIVFATSSGEGSWAAEIVEMTGPGGSREAVNVSHLGTTSAHEFTPGDLVDWGELTLEVAFHPEDRPAMHGALETITITFPNSQASTWAFSGFMTGFEPGTPLEDKMTASITIKVSGVVTVTP